MDYLGSHKSQAVRQAIRTASARLIFLPPYSPDLNPIEQVFAKIRALLRKAEGRTIEAMNTVIAAILAALTPRECAAHIRNSGYAST